MILKPFSKTLFDCSQLNLIYYINAIVLSSLFVLTKWSQLLGVSQYNSKEITQKENVVIIYLLSIEISEEDILKKVGTALEPFYFYCIDTKPSNGAS